MENTITISIVAYHNYKDIKKAIETIEKYTNTNLKKKIYIVDNGTETCTQEEIEDFKNFIKQYSDISYIDAGSNLGFGKGHNKILDIISSKYHAIVNPDLSLIHI
jgi:GT2 family glycosyltransferase